MGSETAGNAVEQRREMTTDVEMDEGLPIEPPVAGSVTEGERLAHRSYSRRDLASLTFLRCDLDSAIFDDTSLSNCRFEECSMSNALFRRTKLIGCHFRKCTLVKTDFSGATIDDTNSFAASDLTGAMGLDAYESSVSNAWTTAEDAAARAEKAWMAALPLGCALAVATWTLGQGQFRCNAPVSVSLPSLPFVLPGAAQPVVVGLALAGAAVFWYATEQYRIYYMRSQILPNRLPSGKMFAHSAWLATRMLRESAPLSIVGLASVAGVFPFAVLWAHWRFQAAAPTAAWALLTAATTVALYSVVLIDKRWLVRADDRARPPFAVVDPHRQAPKTSRRWTLAAIILLLSFPRACDLTCTRVMNATFQSPYSRPPGLNADGWDFSGCDLTGQNFSSARIVGASFDYARLDGVEFQEWDRRATLPMPWESADAYCSSFHGACGTFDMPEYRCCWRDRQGTCWLGPSQRGVPCSDSACETTCGCVPPARRGPPTDGPCETDGEP